MAGRPEEKYEPGELKKLRENLGPMTRDDAKIMQVILGGEVGVEKTEPHIEKQYSKLHNRNRRKSENQFISSSEVSSPILKRESPIVKIKIRYMERLKIYFISAHPDHGIKTNRQSFRAIFDFFSRQKNYINPKLIEHSNYYFIGSLNRLVNSTRFITKNIQKKYIRRQENVFYWEILDSINKWEIERIQEGFFSLKNSTKKITLDACTDLIAFIYFPIIKLSKLNPKIDIEEAVKYAYKLSIGDLHKRDLQVDRLRKAYTEALGEINNVFRIIKYRLYPLLLMSVSTRAYDYKTMFKLKTQEILTFLNMSTQDLISPVSEGSSISDESYSEEPEQQQETIPEIELAIDIGLHQGILLLDRMFPGAGWNTLTDKPDMYPYFKTILDMPEEAALISPADPIQKIVILLAVLKDMLYGFSNIEYGFFRDERGKPAELQEVMEPLIRNWYLFMDELILKNYLSPLKEYCRHLERSEDFIESEYAKRIASDILWLKKKFIFPNILMTLPKILQPRTKITSPELFNSVSRLKTILRRIVLETFSKGETAIETLRNPEDMFHFEIENHVSKRLEHLLKEDRQNLSNQNLIFMTYTIVLVLDDIIHSVRQIGDNTNITGLFRSEDDRGFKPIYSVKAENTFFIYKNKKTILELNPDENTGLTDPITGFFGEKRFIPILNHHISEYSGNPFCIMRINIQNYNSDSEVPRSAILEMAGRTISNSIRLLKDIPFRTGKDNIYIILPETDSKGALKAAGRILSDEKKRNKFYIGITQYLPEDDEERIINILEKTISVSRQLPAPVITYYDFDSGNFKQKT